MITSATGHIIKDDINIRALKLEIDIVIHLHESLKRKESLNLIFGQQNPIMDTFMAVFTSSL